MEENNTPSINISKAFKEAWKGFRGWWIPLCIASSILLFSQSWLPKLIIENFQELKIIEAYKQEYDNFSKQVDSGRNPSLAASHFIKKVSEITGKPETQKIFKTLFYKITILFGILLFLVSVLNIVIILMSKFSVSEKRENIKDYAGKPLTLTPSYLLLTIIKIIPFMFFIIPGFYFYIKLYFTGFIITEKSANPFSAMKKSWEMTEGIFWKTFFIFAVTLIIDIISAVTVIGFIPGTSFKYTLRASLYKQALGK
jgi:ABC-type multidrug transport system fused ATPase/permease subunit